MAEAWVTWRCGVLRWLLPRLIGALLGIVGVSAHAADMLEERVERLSSELRCLVCQNQTIAESQSELAVQLKNEVKQQLAQGASDDEVRAFMVQRYGQFVLYRPPVNPSTWLLWGAPVLLLLVGGVMFIMHWREQQALGDADDEGSKAPEGIVQ